MVKLDCIKGQTLVNRQTQFVLTGISEQSISTLGTCDSSISFLHNIQIPHTFSVVPKEFKLNNDSDGILGRDFLTQYNAIIDYFKHTIYLKVAHNEVKIPFLLANQNKANSQINIDSPSYNINLINSIKLLPRSENFIEINVNTNSNLICLSEEVKPGVFTGNFLVKPENGKVIISVVNNNETEEKFNFKPNMYPVEHFNIFKLNTYEKNNYQNSIPINKLSNIIDIAAESTTTEKESILNMCSMYFDLIPTAESTFASSDIAEHKINLNNENKPIHTRQYRLPEAHKQIVDEHVQDMLTKEIICHSNSPWNSPLLVVPKKPDKDGNKKWRVVIDYRKLNNITINDAFPLPNITEVLEQTSHSKYFSTIDLASGFHQIKMESKDSEKTAFSTPTGHYEFKRMPFGLKGAPATFQRAMNKVLTGLQGIKCLVYLDDIIVFGRNLQDHNEKLKSVFDCLRKYNLKIQPEKCKFLYREIMFLGHIISEHGIQPDKEKINSVLSYPPPTNVKEIQTFLGLANYYRKFIHNFAKIAQPITHLTKKNIPFTWSQECEESFKTLKQKLTTYPILRHPNFKEKFLLTTDASGKALGAILSQGEIGKDLPISYASRTLNPAEQRYSTIEKELLAIVWGVHTFRPYLLGRHFLILSDHKPLIWSLQVKDPSSRLLRWRIKLEEYDFEIHYKPGKNNTNADALSRIPIKECLAVTRSQAKHSGKISPISDNTPISSNSPQEISDPDTIQTILKEFHDLPLGGHQGVIRTYKRIKNHYVWKNMMKDIVAYIKNCSSCQKNKYGKNTKIPMAITTTSLVPFEKIFMDIVGPLPITNNNNKFILTIQDDLSKFSEAFAIPNAEADTVAHTFVTEFICRHGSPQNILTDQGTNFLSQLFKRVCKLLHINKMQTTAYRPQSNGALERSHRTLGEYLRNYTDQDINNWDQWLPYAMFTYNSTPHSSTQITPFKILYGYDPKLPSSIKDTPNPVYNYEDYVQELRARLQSTYAIARENLLKQKNNSKAYYDKNTAPINFEIGDLVLLKVNTSRKKLEPLYHGPYEIVEINSKENSTILINRKLRKVHNNHLKRFHN